MLTSFLNEALDPLAAAKYVRERHDYAELEAICADWRYIIESGKALRFVRAFRADRRCSDTNAAPLPEPDSDTCKSVRLRDGGRCCITGKRGLPWDRPIVCQALPVPTGWTQGSVNAATLHLTFQKILTKSDALVTCP